MARNRHKMTAEERNQQIYEILSGLLRDDRAVTSFPAPFSKDEVEPLFQTNIWGHREIVLTIILARLMDSRFKASQDFYACNPRSIFEKPIRRALREHGIPHRKSGPLNVAKNTKKINKDWATDKHGGEVAMSVVEIVKKIEAAPKDMLNHFAAAFVARYKQEARRIRDLEVTLEPSENPIYIAKLCIDLINNMPDGGATAQFIVGLLMEKISKDREAKVVVTGHRDSVSTTNTTSGKPGDITERISDREDIIYEVTTKMFSDDRMIESYESVKDFDESIKDVFVICRPKDVPETLSSDAGKSYLLATTQFKDLAYYFINIYDYVRALLLSLTPEGRRSFYEELGGYVNEINRSESVKRYFAKWHEEN